MLDEADAALRLGHREHHGLHHGETVSTCRNRTGLLKLLLMLELVGIDSGDSRRDHQRVMGEDANPGCRQFQSASASVANGNRGVGWNRGRNRRGGGIGQGARPVLMQRRTMRPSAVAATAGASAEVDCATTSAVDGGAADRGARQQRSRNSSRTGACGLGGKCGLGIVVDGSSGGELEGAESLDGRSHGELCLETVVEMKRELGMQLLLVGVGMHRILEDVQERLWLPLQPLLEILGIHVLVTGIGSHLLLLRLFASVGRMSLAVVQLLLVLGELFLRLLVREGRFSRSSCSG